MDDQSDTAHQDLISRGGEPDSHFADLGQPPSHHTLTFLESTVAQLTGNNTEGYVNMSALSRLTRFLDISENWKRFVETYKKTGNLERAIKETPGMAEIQGPRFGSRQIVKKTASNYLTRKRREARRLAEKMSQRGLGTSDYGTVTDKVSMDPILQVAYPSRRAAVRLADAFLLVAAPRCWVDSSAAREVRTIEQDACHQTPLGSSDPAGAEETRLNRRDHTSQPCPCIFGRFWRRSIRGHATARLTARFRSDAGIVCDQPPQGLGSGPSFVGPLTSS
jgi:hypothetical protein